MTNQEQRVFRHNSRAGRHGVYNPKHNDRQFDVAHAENINQNRTRLNFYWDWQSGLQNHEENQSGQYPAFNQVERDFYGQRYGGSKQGKHDAIYLGKASREKNDHIIQNQQARIVEQEQHNAELPADNEAQNRIIAEKAVELEKKLEKLADADTVSVYAFSHKRKQKKEHPVSISAKRDQLQVPPRGAGWMARHLCVRQPGQRPRQQRAAHGQDHRKSASRSENSR